MIIGVGVDLCEIAGSMLQSDDMVIISLREFSPLMS